ncbi:MAG: hypothetical protein NT175_07740 [Bacteroidetes bacterium]|nr:hypothetical protein [Bacteroidota bacterium]
MIRSLTWDDVNNAAKRLMLPDQIQWVIVGDRAKIEQGIREMGIKDIYFVDGDGNPVK